MKPPVTVLAGTAIVGADGKHLCHVSYEEGDEIDTIAKMLNEHAELVSVLRDLRAVVDFRPVCQRFVIDICRCKACVVQRADSLIAKVDGH